MAGQTPSARPEADRGEVQVRPAELRDAAAYAEHIVQHLAESGRPGVPVFAPGHRPSREDIRDNAAARWARRITEPLWGREWLLVSSKDGIVGHLELLGGRISTEMHRATLGMGMFQPYTGQGHGRRLLDTALAWARAETPLVWIDLGVFAGNTPALKLYERYGFVRAFVKEDAFRLDDATQVDDVQMSLRIR